MICWIITMNTTVYQRILITMKMTIMTIDNEATNLDFLKF